MFDFSLRPKVKTYGGQPVWTLERKFDGWRMTAIRDARGVKFYGRDPGVDINTKMQKQDDIVQFMLRQPNNTVIEMEIFSEFSTDVSSSLKDGTRLNFEPFAVPVLAGRQLRAMGMWHYLRLVSGIFQPMEEFDEPTVLDPIQMARLAKKRGWEGFVVKAAPYTDWYKIKPIRTADVIVTGWHEGKGRNSGRLGALSVGLFDGTPVGKISGFSDDQRDEISPRDIGRVVEVEYDSLTSGGKLRFAQFLRFRDDKPAKECNGKDLA